MRTTGNMLVNNMIKYISTNQTRMEKYQYQMATGKKIRVPSDDPVVAARALKLRTDVSELEQFKRNAKDAENFLLMTETAVEDVGDILKRTYELAVQAANGSNTTDETQKIRMEVEQLKKQLIQTANSNFNGRQLFSGFKTDQKLMDDDGNFIINVPSADKIKYEVGIGDNIEVNVTGGDLFNLSGAAAAPGTPDMISYFNNFISALDGNVIPPATTSQESISQSIEDMQKAMNNALRVRADIGARTNRIDLTLDRIDKSVLNFTELMSKNEDVDLAETLMLLQNEENVYQASLAGGARIIQTSLADFLR